MTIYAFAGQKGGAGKTTAALATATEWQRRGRRVLLVDADPQGTATTWSNVAEEAGHPAPTVVAMGRNLHKADQLPRLAPGFDVVVIDCPPRIAEIQRAALLVADVAILPCAPSGIEAWALGSSLELVEEARVFRPGLVARVLITRRDKRTLLGHRAADALAEAGIELLDTSLGFRVQFIEAVAEGLGVTAYAPSSPAAFEVRCLVDELDGLAAGKGAAGDAA
jgi:chromosome partitioning protein